MENEQEYEPSEARKLLKEHLTEEDAQKLFDAKKQGKEALRAELKNLRERFKQVQGE